MPPEISVRIDGEEVRVRGECSVAAALRQAGYAATRLAHDGSRRAACCGMGICFECRVQIDGRERLACITPVAAGMEIWRDA